jgi:hypothetical protein
VRLHRIGSPLVPRAYFPGYLFADLETPWQIRAARRARSLLGVLGEAAIPDNVMSNLRLKADAQGYILDGLEIGKCYRLDRPGSLSKLVATLERLDDKGRLRISVHLFGRDCPATLSSLDDLDRNSRHPPASPPHGRTKRHNPVNLFQSP